MGLRLLFISALFLAASLSEAAHAKVKAQNHIIVIENMQFSPGELKIQKGESIEWVNRDLVPHTATTLKPGFDSKTIDPGKTWVFRSKSKGTFDYKCDFHPTMKATVMIE